MTGIKSDRVPAVELQQVSFSYHKKQILKEASMVAYKGEAVGIVGLSGSGKTTLIRLINGAMAREGRYKHEGRILILGQEADRIEHLNQSIGTVYQDTDSQILFTSVVDEIVFGMENHCYDKALMETRLQEVTDLLGIDHLLDKNPNQLSGGEKQLVVLASLLCLDVAILILDEALAGVDSPSRAKVLEVIEDVKGKGKTVLMIEHNPDNLRVADRVYRVEDCGIYLND